MLLTDYVTLGRSGLRVSPFCLGTMTFGEDWGWESTPTRPRPSWPLLARGGNFIDTPRLHQRSLGSDHRGGHRSNAARRDRIVLATKFFGNLYPGDPNGGGAGRKSLVAACEQSLRRLKTDLQSISTGCTAGTVTRQSTRRCAGWTTWFAAAKCATSDSRTRPRGSREAQMAGAVSWLGAGDGNPDVVLASRADG